MAASFFSKRLLEQISLHAQFGVHSLKTTVFLFNGLHLAHHGCIHPAILRAPLAQHRRADPVPPAQIRHKSSNLSLAQQRHDLDFRKTAFIHRILLSHLAKKILHTKPLNHGGITQRLERKLAVEFHRSPVYAQILVCHRPVPHLPQAASPIPFYRTWRLRKI